MQRKTPRTKEKTSVDAPESVDAVNFNQGVDVVNVNEGNDVTDVNEGANVGSVNEDNDGVDANECVFDVNAREGEDDSKIDATICWPILMINLLKNNDPKFITQHMFLYLQRGIRQIQRSN